MGKGNNRLSARDDGPVEIELRLVGEPEALKAAFGSFPTTSGTDRREAAATLESSYFDTPDHRLRAKGLALRVRRQGDAYRQTLKSGDDAQGSLLCRGEWETPLADDRPRPDRLPEMARTLLRKAAGKRALQKLFTTRVERCTRQLIVDGPEGRANRIEVALDLGEIETDAGVLPVTELEFELLEGEPRSLYQLAGDLQGTLPLRLETRSKSSRAYDHIGDRPPSWHRKSKIPLDRSTSVDDAMAAIFRNGFDQWLANQAAAMDGRDPEGVHQMRVGQRRLRSALSLFHKIIPESELEWLRPAARQTMHQLGPARDWDVFQRDLLTPVLAARPADKALIALSKRVETRRRSSYRALRKSLSANAYNSRVLRVGEWLERLGWQTERCSRQAERGAMPIGTFASRLLKKRHDRVRARGEDFSNLPVAERHEVRILLKKLRYAAEFFAPLFKKKAVKPYLGSVKALQDSLGHLNDLAVAETLLRELTTGPGKRDIGGAAGMVIGWHERGVADLEADLVGRWQAFAERSPFWT